MRPIRPVRTILLLSLGLAAAACGGPSGPVDGDRAMAHVRRFVEIGPRPFGSDNLAATADYIEAEIEKLGLELERHEPVHEKEDKTIRNLYCRIDGADPDGGPIVMIGSHYDTKLTDGCEQWTHGEPFVGAIDGGGGPAVLIELARAIQARDQKLDANVWLYWIDAEESIDWEWNDDRALLGSEAFCEWLSAEGLLPRVKAFVLLDLMGSKNLKFDKDGDSNQRLIDLFATAGEQLGIGERMFRMPSEELIGEYTKRGLEWGIKDDHLNFVRRGVPSVLLIDFQRRIPPHLQKVGKGQQPFVDPDYEQWWHTPDDDLDAMDADSLAIVGNLVMKALPALDDFVTRKKRK